MFANFYLDLPLIVTNFTVVAWSGWIVPSVHTRGVCTRVKSRAEQGELRPGSGCATTLPGHSRASLGLSVNRE